MPSQIKAEVFLGSGHSRTAKTTPWRALHESGAGIRQEWQELNLIFQAGLDPAACLPLESSLSSTRIAGNGITAGARQIAASSSRIIRDNTASGNPAFPNCLGRKNPWRTLQEFSPGSRIPIPWSSCNNSLDLIIFSLLELGVHHLLLPHSLFLGGWSRQEREGAGDTRQGSSGITQKSREIWVGAAGKCSIAPRAASALRDENVLYNAAGTPRFSHSHQPE